jgi:hypothetical protein
MKRQRSRTFPDGLKAVSFAGVKAIAFAGVPFKSDIGPELP